MQNNTLLADFIATIDKKSNDDIVAKAKKDIACARSLLGNEIVRDKLSAEQLREIIESFPTEIKRELYDTDIQINDENEFVKYATFIASKDGMVALDLLKDPVAKEIVEVEELICGLAERRDLPNGLCEVLRDNGTSPLFLKDGYNKLSTVSLSEIFLSRYRYDLSTHERNEFQNRLINKYIYKYYESSRLKDGKDKSIYGIPVPDDVGVDVWRITIITEDGKRYIQFNIQRFNDRGLPEFYDVKNEISEALYKRIATDASQAYSMRNLLRTPHSLALLAGATVGTVPKEMTRARLLSTPLDELSRIQPLEKSQNLIIRQTLLNMMNILNRVDVNSLESRVLLTFVNKIDSVLNCKSDLNVHDLQKIAGEIAPALKDNAPSLFEKVKSLLIDCQEALESQEPPALGKR